MKLTQILNEIKNISLTEGTSTPYICGGVPRDKYMNSFKNISDIDITTGDKSIGVLSSEFYKKFRKPDTLYKVMNDGHSKIVYDGISFDFSSNYISPNASSYLLNDGISNPTSLELEMYSRDFTCNSLLLDFDLKTIKDPTKRGIDDINKKILRTCMRPEITLGEDNKRIVRVIYLSAKLNFKIEKSILDWIRNNKKLIMTPGEEFVLKKINKAVQYNEKRTADIINYLDLWDSIPINERLVKYIL